MSVIVWSTNVLAKYGASGRALRVIDCPLVELCINLTSLPFRMIVSCDGYYDDYFDDLDYFNDYSAIDDEYFDIQRMRKRYFFDDDY